MIFKRERNILPFIFQLNIIIVLYVYFFGEIVPAAAAGGKPHSQGKVSVCGWAPPLTT